MHLSYISLYDDLPSDEFDSSAVGEQVPCFAHSVQLAIRDGLQKISVSRTNVAKCCKLAKLTHQSAKFRVAFKDAFGRGRAVPSSNDMWWNSVFHEIKCSSFRWQLLSNLLKKKPGELDRHPDGGYNQPAAQSTEQVCVGGYSAFRRISFRRTAFHRMSLRQISIR